MGWAIQAHKAKKVGPQNQGGRFWATKGLVEGMQGDDSTTELGGIMEVAMLGFDLGWV